MKPENYTHALFELIRVSSEMHGPNNEQISSLAIDVPAEWIVAVTDGWHAYAERYMKPYFKELLIAEKPVRFLRVGLLPPMKLAPKPYCTLCGLSVQPPRRSWHNECIEAFLPHTQFHWKRLCRSVLKRDRGCVHCGVPFIRQRGRPRHKFEFDHIVPVGLGGPNILSNIQLLCKPCHIIKTKVDVRNIKAHKLEQK